MRPVLITALAFLAACTGKPSFEDPVLTDRKLNLEEYFDGRLEAYGQFQDIFGTVRRQFTVQITGDWDGSRLRLVEDFLYEDGATEQRIWTLTKTGEDSWTGSAPGVIGTASGEEDGDRFNWQYTIDLPVPASGAETGTIRVTFDDWMWLQSETQLFNRAYVSKYGVGVGEALISFRKLD